MQDTMDRERTWQDTLGLVLAIVSITALSVLSLWAFGFFFLPIALAGVVVWLFARALRGVNFRNRMTNERPSLNQRFADGQPLGRTNTNERELPYRDQDLEPPWDLRDRHAPP